MSVEIIYDAFLRRPGGRGAWACTGSRLAPVPAGFASVERGATGGVVRVGCSPRERIRTRVSQRAFEAGIGGNGARHAADIRGDRAGRALSRSRARWRGRGPRPAQGRAHGRAAATRRRRLFRGVGRAVNGSNAPKRWRGAALVFSARLEPLTRRDGGGGGDRKTIVGASTHTPPP